VKNLCALVATLSLMAAPAQADASGDVWGESEGAFDYLALVEQQ
jgi:hypothetical protein